MILGYENLDGKNLIKYVENLYILQSINGQITDLIFYTGNHLGR